jgi:putative FmdB family regulatory protein
MPTYDFVCLNCGQRFDVFLSYSQYGSTKVVCVHCGSQNVRRRMTRVRVAKSEDSRMEGMADESALEGLENDPQALGRMMKKMGKEMGEEAGQDFDAEVDRAVEEMEEEGGGQEGTGGGPAGGDDAL